MASILEIVNGISQALHAKHHGGSEIGLKRETEDLVQGVSIYDPRVMDGFGVQFQGNMLIVKYHSEMPLIKIHDKNFETDIRKIVKDITAFIKGEYKKVTKKTLNLTEHGDINILVQSANRRTAYVNAVQNYVIDGVEGIAKEERSKHQLNADITKGWLMNVRQPKASLKENTILKEEIQEEGLAKAAALAAFLLGSGGAYAAPTAKSQTQPATTQAAVIDNDMKLALKGYLENVVSPDQDLNKAADAALQQLNKNNFEDPSIKNILNALNVIKDKDSARFKKLVELGKEKVRTIRHTGK